MTVRPAVRADFETFGAAIPLRARAVTGVDENGKVIAIGGVLFQNDGTTFGFAYLSDDARRAKFALHRQAIKFLNVLASEGVSRILAVAERRISPNADEWLLRLGFEKLNDDWWSKDLKKNG